MPRDLARFKGLPMRVHYRAPAAAATAAAAAAPAAAATEADEVLDLLTYDAAAGVTTWKVADVRANRAGMKKGQVMSKKTRERRLSLPVADLLKVHLHIDV